MSRWFCPVSYLETDADNRFEPASNYFPLTTIPFPALCHLGFRIEIPQHLVSHISLLYPSPLVPGLQKVTSMSDPGYDVMYLAGDLRRENKGCSCTYIRCLFRFFTGNVSRSRFCGLTTHTHIYPDQEFPRQMIRSPIIFTRNAVYVQLWNTWICCRT